MPAQVYETHRLPAEDPALLEWVDGSTFKMRVFPLKPRQEKRILLSYTQKLPVALRPARRTASPPATASTPVGDWSFHVRVKNGAGLRLEQRVARRSRQATDGNDLLLDARREERQARPRRGAAT